MNVFQQSLNIPAATTSTSALALIWWRIIPDTSSVATIALLELTVLVVVVATCIAII